MPPQQQEQNDRNGVEAGNVTLEEPRSKGARNETTTTESTHTPEEADSFLKYVLVSKGPPQIILWSLFYAVAVGSTISVVPSVITDRYAKINHGFDGGSCTSYGAEDKPHECSLASNDAMNTSAVSSFVSNMLTFLTAPLVGSISDERGRRNLLLISAFLSILAPICFVLLQLINSMHPAWYYAAEAIKGLVSWMAIALSSLSDVLPKKWRAPGFGLVLAGFSLGFAFSPLLALVMDHLHLSIFSSCLMIGLFILALFFLPETLSRETAEETRQKRAAANRNESTCSCIVRNLKRPVKEMTILNRSRLFRLLASLAFFSGMVFSADQLLIYYVQDKFGATDKQISAFLVMVGVLNILVQLIVMKPLIERIGEKMLLVVAFFFGALHNFMYGLGTHAAFIYVGGALSSIRTMSFPTISAVKANNVDEHEQGQIQGALYSVSSLAAAVGPLLCRFVYYGTKNYKYPGSGSMFVAAALSDIIAVGVCFALPKDEVDSRRTRRDEVDSSTNVAVDESTLSRPLLHDENTA